MGAVGTFEIELVDVPTEVSVGEPIEIRVGTDALAVVVSKENDFIENATMAELAQLFSEDAETSRRLRSVPAAVPWEVPIFTLGLRGGWRFQCLKETQVSASSINRLIRAKNCCCM